MPLRSSGIIVVDKTSIVNTSATESSQSRLNCLGGIRKNIECNENEIMQATNNNLIKIPQRTISSPNTKSNANSLALVGSSFNQSQMNQISRQQQNIQQQQQSQQQQQHEHQHLCQINQNVLTANQTNSVMVSEDLIEQTKFGNTNAAARSTSGGVINLTANELMNQTQIIKFVSDGNGTNVLIDASANGPNTVNNSNIIAGHHGNSKVHVISNVTLVSKQPSNSSTGQTQQTINFVNAKGLPYLTTKNQTQTSVQKIVNIPFKANNLVKSSTGTAQHLQQHYATNTNISTGATTVVQKVTVPRNVQVLTRVQNLAPSSPQMQHQQPHQSSTSIQQQPQQHHISNNQMILQQKFMTSVVAAPSNNNKSNAVKKQTVTQPMKLVQQKVNNQVTNVGSIKNFVQHPQQQLQNLTPITPINQTVKQMKSQKIIRQISHGQNVVASQTTQNVNVGSYSINNKHNNVCQQQGTTTKFLNTASKNSNVSSSKYVMQNHVVLPSANQACLNKVSTGNNNSNNSTNNINNCSSNNSNNNLVVQQHIINPGCGNLSSNSNSSNSNNSAIGSGNAIKYVNAHGTILQSQQLQNSVPQSIQQQSQSHYTKARNNNIHHHHNHNLQQQHHQQQQQQVHGSSQSQKHVHHQQLKNQGDHFMDSRNSLINPDANSNNAYLSTSVNSKIQTVKPTGSGEDIMIVNSTQMTEEIMSARILQSLSQKAMYNNNARQYQNSAVQIQFQSQQQSLQHTQQSHKQIQKTITQTAPPQSNLIVSPISRSDYPIYNPIHIQQQQQQQQQSTHQPHPFHHHQIHQNQQQLQPTQTQRQSQQTRLAVTERRQHYESPHVSRNSTDYFKVKGDNAPAAQQAEHEDDIIGEEVRPKPVSTNDARLQALHAVLQDHTYVAAMPTRLPLEIQNTTTLNMCGSSISSNLYMSNCSLGQDNGIGNASLGQQQITTIAGIVPTSPISPSVTFPFLQGMHSNHNQDDDANSVISDESRTGPGGLDNDLGEETETAPEAEAEDDSVTRCICDLTHDDGYMICCDKCSAWQHVDCMGIDRQNIPDEYLCEICQPREVDRARAKNLQLAKRREQNSFPSNNAQNNTNTTIGGNFSHDENATFPQVGNPHDRFQPISIATTSTMAFANSTAINKKSKNIAGTKRKELIKRTKKDRTNNKRREVKRVTRRKTKNNLNNSDANSCDKSNANVSQWLENYEVAVTNHYSPELRARLHAISKQQNIQNIAPENKALKNCSGMQSKCTTVPFSGGKIIISNFDIQPNTPIIELRGKFMLTTQYKTQNPTVNTNINISPPNSPHTMRNQKIPGPFIFFYRLCNDINSGPEVCVDTRTYANGARFVRRSCRPNAEIQHYFEKGTLHLYIVSTTFLKGGTEITIKHEPHDLAALENKQITFPVTPTSTICACDTPKDCLFANQSVNNTKISRKVAINGCVSEVKSKVVSNKKDIQNNISRGRSISSSGESNTGLLSPNNNFNTGFYNPATTTSLQHDSGVYTSSSSPSVSLPSPTHTQVINSPPQQNHQKLQTQPQTTDTLVVSVSTPIAVVESSSIVTKGTQKPNTTGRKPANKHVRHVSTEEPSAVCPTPSGHEEKIENRKLSREDRKMEAIIRAFAKMEKTQQRKQELKQARSSISSSAKQRNSSSPSPKRTKSQSMSEVDSGNTLEVQHTRKSSLSSSTRKKKRKGSKSHSANHPKRRRRINSNDSDIATSEESSSLLSPPIISSSNHNSSLLAQNEDSECQIQVSVSDVTDNRNSPVNDQNVNQAAGLLLALAHNDKVHSQHIKIENEDVNNTPDREALVSPVPNNSLLKEEKASPQTPPIVSSTCLLVEAAVGPLENIDTCSGEFKLPTKTKTKKSIMNDWLNQSTDFQQNIHQQNLSDEVQMRKQSPTQVSQPFEPKGLDTLVQAAASICDYRRSTSSPAAFMAGQSQDGSQNFSIVAKKVEEFIHQTDINFQCSDETVKFETNAEQTNNLSLPLQSLTGVNNCSGSSSVKKRWLRQAISEECSDDLATCLPASSPTQSCQNSLTDFTTPLKKRRVIRQCTDDEQQSTLTGDLNMGKTCENVSQSDIDITQALIELNTEPKTEIKEEYCEFEEDVDILTSPLPEEKIILDDNLVKIEPEDENKEEIDVEREESSSNEITKNVEILVECKTEQYPTESMKVEIPELKSTDMEKQNAKLTPVKLETKLSENENYNNVSDEIADIQKRLHSFHTENIMILQSRNKKSKISRFLKLDCKMDSENQEAKNALKAERQEKRLLKHGEVKILKKEERHRMSKKKHLNFDMVGKEDDCKRKELIGRKKDTSKSSEIVDLLPHEMDDTKATLVEEKCGDEKKDQSDITIKTEVKDNMIPTPIDEKQLQAALTIPNFSHSILTPTSTQVQLSSYVLNNSEPSMDISTLLSAQPHSAPLAQPSTLSQSDLITSCVSNASTSTVNTITSHSPPLHLPYYNTIYGKLVDKSSSSNNISSAASISSSNILLSDYLDTKAKSYGTLGGYVSHSALFGLNNNKTSVTNSTTSTTLNTVVSSANLLKTSEPLSVVASPSCSKILTKTASADPRLNPSLTAPEPTPTPKRKLSINEYRKRKQQSTEAASNSGNNNHGVNSSNVNDAKLSSSKASSKSTETYEENEDKNDSSNSSENESYNLDKINDTKVQFSPTPTLLEQQQETLCERLKSLTSKSTSLCSSSPSGIKNCTKTDVSFTPILSSSDVTSTNVNSFSLSNSSIKKDEFLLSHNLANSSLESISSSSSPLSSKESTPERESITP